MGIKVGRPLRASIDESTAGDRTIVAAVPGKSIVVLNYLLLITSNEVYWESTTTAISGPLTESHQAGDDDFGVLETAVGEPLALNLDGTGQVSGFITYATV
jgi:hypothetical protein